MSEKRTIATCGLNKRPSGMVKICAGNQVIGLQGPEPSDDFAGFVRLRNEDRVGGDVVPTGPSLSRDDEDPHTVKVVLEIRAS